jgi:hypothetical protein
MTLDRIVVSTTLHTVVAFHTIAAFNIPLITYRLHCPLYNVQNTFPILVYSKEKEQKKQHCTVS